MSYRPIPIAALFGGVSRQPASLRFVHQMEDIENCLLTVSRGLEKRAGTLFINSPDNADGSLSVTGPTQDKHIHFIERDENERFIVITDPLNASAPVEVFDLTGTKMTVTYDDVAIKTYLTSGITDAALDYRMLTVTDATLILNRNTITALKGAELRYENEAASFPNKKANGRNKVSFDNFDQPPSNADLILTPTVGPDATDGAIWYAREDSPGHPAGFYRVISDDVSPWYERIRTEAADCTIDEATMPVRMDYDGATTFNFAYPSWIDRLSGDGELNPGPSFIGRPIADITFNDNLFWFGAEENVASSQRSDLFNLWIDQVALVGDSDPIDVQLSTNAVTQIDFLVPFDESLVILTKGARQFRVGGSDSSAITPINVSIKPTTRYKSESYVAPVTLGNQLYFVSEKNDSSQLWEYNYNIDVDSNIATDVTFHADTYVPLQASQMSVSENNDFLFTSVSSETNALYVYKTLWNGAQKVQDAWFKYTFDSGNEILGHHVFDNDLYLVLRRASKVWLEKLSILQPSADTQGGKDMPYALLMDRQQYLTGVYSSSTDLTTWTLPFTDTTIDEVVLGPEWDAENRVATRLAATNVAGATLTAQGNWSAHDAYLGRSFVGKFTLSEVFVRSQEGQVVEGALQLGTLTLRHRETGFYEVHVTPSGRDTQVHRFTARRIGDLSATTGSIALNSTQPFKAKIMASSAGTTIEIKNDTPAPMNIVSMEFTSTFQRARAPITN